MFINLGIRMYRTLTGIEISSGGICHRPKTAMEVFFLKLKNSSELRWQAVHPRVSYNTTNVIKFLLVCNSYFQGK